MASRACQRVLMLRSSTSTARLRLPVLRSSVLYRQRRTISSTHVASRGSVGETRPGKEAVKSCADCGKLLKALNFHKHKCYRKRRGMKLYVCKHCGTEFSSNVELVRHVDRYDNKPHPSILSKFPIEVPDLSSPKKFSNHEAALSQSLIHATDVESAASIMRDQFLRGGSATGYDDALFTDDKAPASLFTELRPASDQKLFAYSFYPVEVPLLDKVILFTLDMDFLADPDFLLFHHKTSPTQFGPTFMSVALSQAVFVRRSDVESMKFARAHFVELDKRRNCVLRYSDNGGWSFATKFSDNGMDFTHKVNVVVLGGLGFESRMKVECIEGRRAGSVNRRFPCTEPGCYHESTSVFTMKEHLLRYHSDIRGFLCSFDGCNYAGRTRRCLYEHEKNHAGSVLCCDQVGCSFTTRRRFDMRRHTVAAHCGIPRRTSEKVSLLR